MLGFFKGKSKDNIIYSPCKGKVVPITEVSDPTFSEKVLGDGFAVIPSEGRYMLRQMVRFQWCLILFML